MKRTTSDIISLSKDKHGDRYDYSLVNFVNERTKILIICKEHGKFLQRSFNHIKGQGCPKCGGTIRYKSDEYILKATKIHGDRYDYTKTVYELNNKKIIITCKIHGDFEQRPGDHLKTSGCAKCGGVGRNNIENLILKFNNIHNNKYDYSKSIYVSAHKKITIICKEHGVFEQTPHSHSKGQGCPKCSGKYIPTNEEFILRCKNKHGDRYDYSKSIYVSAHKKITIICKEHGDFEQSTGAHLSGQGCPKCSGKFIPTNEEFILRCKNKHGDKYDYSKVVYKNMQTKIILTCIKHNHKFEQTPTSHLKSGGCPICDKRKQLTLKEFIIKSNEIHNNKYNYEKVLYVNSTTKIIINCKSHGDFEIKPHVHISGVGCSECMIYDRWEHPSVFKKILIKYNITTKKEYKTIRKKLMKENLDLNLPHDPFKIYKIKLDGKYKD